MHFFLNSTISSQKVKDGLQQAMDLRFALGKTQRRPGGAGAAAFQRHYRRSGSASAQLEGDASDGGGLQSLDKFDAQETQIVEKYQADVKKLQDVEHQQQKEFEDFLNAFSP